ncbi:sugar transferase [Escherichia coli]
MAKPTRWRKWKNASSSDLEYIREWSVWFDIKIVFLTVFKGFVNKAAY